MNERLKRLFKRKPRPTVEDIIAAFQDGDAQVRLISRRALVNELQYEREKYHAAFDKTYASSLLDISTEHARTASMLLFASLRLEEFEENGRTAIAYAHHALKSVEAAVELTRSGFVMQPNVLVRSAVEYLAAAFAVISDRKQAERLAKDNFKSAKAITAASKKLPIIGRIWGLLSNQFVHVGPLHSSLKSNVVSSSRQPQVLVALNHVRATLILAPIVCEAIVAHMLKETRFWKVQPDGGLRYDPSPAVLAQIEEFLTEPDGT